tara:strand:- start:5805 stop:6530 length:726 start_codon:yes stop_codon:yes gene_type:complete
MRRTYLVAATVLGLLCGLAIFLPLRMGLAVAGQETGGAVYGRVWDGQIFNAVIAGRPVAHLRVAVSPLPLVTGRLVTHVRATDPDVNGQAWVEQSLSGGLSLRDARLVLAPRQISGALESLFSPDDVVSVRLDALRMTGDDCVSATGEARTDAVYNLGQRANLNLPSLSGPIRCSDGAVHVTLNGQAPDATVEVDLRVSDMTQGWSVTIETTSSDLSSLLVSSGFTQDGQRWTLNGSEALP